MITGYPNKGVGFFVRRRTWPDNIKILLTDSTLKVKVPLYSHIGTQG